MKITHLILLFLTIVLTACSSSGPDVPKAAKQFSDTQACVEPVAEMRKNHMNYILHQRDETVLRGIRTRQHAFEECINCHVTANAAGEYPDVSSDEHFCEACHSYAAVKVDCFQCHNDNPVRDSQLTAVLPAGHSETNNSTRVVLNND